MNATPENHSMALQPRSETEGVCMTEEEYLASEPYSEVRREYIDGRAICYGRCECTITMHYRPEYSSRIRKSSERHVMRDFYGGYKVRLLVKKYVYPDVIVDCSKIEMKNYFANAPMIIVEVLSKSTRRT